MNFIKTGTLFISKSKGLPNIVAAFEASRRYQEAVNVLTGRSLAAQMSHYLRGFLPDRGMPENIQSILKKVRSWSRTGSTIKRDHNEGRESIDYEYAGR
jgi:hypothetical protein